MFPSGPTCLGCTIHLSIANATIVTDLNVQAISCLGVKLSQECMHPSNFLQVKFLQQDSGQDGILQLIIMLLNADQVQFSLSFRSVFF